MFKWITKEVPEEVRAFKGFMVAIVGGLLFWISFAIMATFVTLIKN